VGPFRAKYHVINMAMSWLIRAALRAPLAAPRWGLGPSAAAPRALLSSVPVEPPAVKGPPKGILKEAETPDAQGRLYSTGRRKRATARVWLLPGDVREKKQPLPLREGTSFLARGSGLRLFDKEAVWSNPPPPPR
jgi:hypothetical protein